MQKVTLGKTVLHVYVPARIRCPLEPEYSPIQARIEKFQVSIMNAIIKLCDGNKKAHLALKLQIDYKNITQSDNTLVEIRCWDRVIGTVYISRTEFNIDEAVFALYPDVFKLLKREWKDYKKLEKTFL